jgi:hypothetical protein
MPFTAEQLSYAGIHALNHTLNKKPTDLYNTDRPLLKFLNKTKKSFPGSKQYITEKLRFTNDSNLQAFGPDEEVTYNRKRTLADASFAWTNYHDGFALTEEELMQNSIRISDERNATPTESEVNQLANLLDENIETLRLGAAEKFDYKLHLDGTADPDDIVGLDALVSTTPTTGTVGGINRATTTYWRNFSSGTDYATGIPSTTGLLVAQMEKAWRSAMRIGGAAPDFILAGSKAIDAYRVDAKAAGSVQIMMKSDGYSLDGANSDLSFHGVPIVWDPVLDDLQTALAPAEAEWDKRMYFLNSKTIRLRPGEGQDWIPRKPPRAYNRYTHYWGLTWRGAMTITRPASMAVLSIA